MKFDRNQHKSLPPSLSLSRDRDYLIAWSKRKSSPRNHCHRVGKSVASGVPYGIGYEVSIPELRLVRISPASLTCRHLLSFVSFSFLATTSFPSKQVVRRCNWPACYVNERIHRVSQPRISFYIYIRVVSREYAWKSGWLHEKIRSKISWIKFSLCERVEEK